MRSAGFSGHRDELGDVPSDPRHESRAQRDDRNLAELIQELRVVGLGVQVLFGFLLSLPFTVRFSRLSTGQRDLYLASIVLSAIATVLLVTDYVAGTLPAALITALVACMLAVLWFAVPLARREERR